MTSLIILLTVVGSIFAFDTVYAKKLSTFFFKYDDKIKAVAKKYNIPWYWIKGIALNESHLGENPLVKAGKASSDGKSYGIMQMTLETANTYAKRKVTIDELNNVDFSFDIAGKFLANLSEAFAGVEKPIIMAYNQGKQATIQGSVKAENYYYRYLYWKNKILKGI